MTDKDKLYIAGLLHDIGKFIERAKLEEWQNKALKYVQNNQSSKNYAHKRYSAAFINNYKKDFLNSSVESLCLWHHKGDDRTKEDYESINNKGVLLKLLRIADNCASSERKEDSDLKPVDYYLAKIHSPFQDIKLEYNNGKNLELDKSFYLNNESLTIEKSCYFPSSDSTYKENEYKGLVKEFLIEFENNIENEDSLLALMEKYLLSSPAQTPVSINGKESLYKPDINLYDHSRVVAAIAICLYGEYETGSWKGMDSEILSNDYQNKLSSPCILIIGNISGIQDFIFNVTSEKAAQKLKGKSFFVQLLADICASYIIEKLNLKKANILYSGGGNFFILASKCSYKLLEESRKEISKSLIGTGLFLAIGYSEVTLNDFGNFSKVFSNSVKEAGKSKFQKFKECDYEDIFEPKPQKLNQDGIYKDLTDELKKSKDYFIRKKRDDDNSEYQLPFYKLGYAVEFHNEVTGISKESILFNDTNFSKSYQSFRFAVKDLPLWSKKELQIFEAAISEIEKRLEIERPNAEENPGSIITFERLADFSYLETGTDKLGILKMDIDNLGKIFSKGLPEELRSISRIASISRSIRWFFEGYMNTLINSDEFKNRLYTVFSGGDDFFLVGGWNKVFDFTRKVYKEFREFVCEHPAITLSASLVVVDENYPISRFADISEKRLHEAKYLSKNKNSINVFDTVVNWNEFDDAFELKEKIVGLIKNYGVNRALIDKIRKSSIGFEKIQDNALKGKIQFQKVWKLGYYLRDLINPKNIDDENLLKVKSEINSIVKKYEELIFKAFNGELTSIKIFPIAARWAELETRNLENKKGDSKNE